MTSGIGWYTDVTLLISNPSLVLNQTLSIHQSSLPGLCPITDAVEALALASSIEARGAIFTRREVVSFILDLSGYTEDRPLLELRFLEPAFGGGDFLLVAIERLLGVWKASGVSPDALRPCIRAVELHGGTFETTRLAVILLLTEHGIASMLATGLADTWLIQGDFLLTEFPDAFDVVVGNPPYVRQELIPDVLLAEYRSRYQTIYDRADLYIPFIERSLQLLSDRGKLGFICSDRWMKNRYGGPLRQLVAEQFQLQIYVDMVDTQAFHTAVVAYPAITIMGREKQKATRIARCPALDSQSLSKLAKDLVTIKMPNECREIVGVASDSQPWILDSSDQMALLRRLEKDFPLLEDTGCKVGIGVATGADSAFIAPFDELHVEPERKLRLVTTRDIVSGDVRWRGLGVINPFADAGGLVNLSDFPLLRRYLEERKPQIAGRHCAQKTPANWYRTIDRITPALAQTPKLLIPDIKGDAQIVYEKGNLYPHHNLYFITSVHWNLLALQAVLMSGIARLFVSTYSTKMRGGYLRFQAQYLRRIHIPQWKYVGPQLRDELIHAAQTKDLAACNRAVFELYGFSSGESAALQDSGPSL